MEATSGYYSGEKSTLKAGSVIKAFSPEGYEELELNKEYTVRFLYQDGDVDMVVLMEVEGEFELVAFEDIDNPTYLVEYTNYGSDKATKHGESLNAIQLNKVLSKVMVDGGFANKITTRKRVALSKYGEWHAHYVAIYGDFTTTYNGNITDMVGKKITHEKDSVWYSDRRAEIIEALRAEGMVVHDNLGGKYEILVEIDQFYYKESGETKFYRFRTQRAIDPSQIGKSKKLYFYTIINRKS